MKPTNSTKAPGVFAVTLGCPKNRVDTEVILGDLLSSGYELLDSPGEADVVIVNTCGFLASARQESIETLSGLASSLKPGARLVAAGCMVEKFGDEIRAAVPGISVMTGTRNLLGLRPALEGRPAVTCGDPTSANPRLVTTGSVAYLKVADGCNRRCSYCIIPAIKGQQRSRTVDDLVIEARGLVSSGVREIVVIAQDLSRYGSDLGNGDSAVRLVRELGGVYGIDWVRLMYLFPTDIPDELIDAVAESPNCLPYFDMPVQHADDNVLAGMRRGTTRRDLVRLVERIRGRIPGAVLRTTLMTGFPGETREAFDNMMSFVSETCFDMVGVFEFSPEPGSAAALLPDQVPAALAAERRLELEAQLSTIAADRRRDLVGRVVDAVAESVEDDGTAVGRVWFQAPEVDGVTRISGLDGDDDASCRVLITGFEDADFTARKY